MEIPSRTKATASVCLGLGGAPAEERTRGLNERESMPAVSAGEWRLPGRRFSGTATLMAADHGSCELLHALVRQSVDNAVQPMHQLAGKVRDWELLLRLAREHGLMPMLFSRLADVGPAVPPTVLDRLQAEYNRNAFHNLANAAELLSLLRALDQHLIPAMPFKGVVLGASIYRDPTTRPAGDLDLLIHHRHLERATAVLLERGYELKTPVREDGSPTDPDYYEYHFERQADGMVIELRWRLELTRPRFRHNLGMDWVWHRRQVAMLAGSEVPNLDPEITLLVLCMHASKHAWSRLIWICDVAELLSAFPGLDWKDATQEAKQSGLWRALALGALLAHRVAGASVPQAVLRRFESDATACNLARHVEENLFEAPGSTPMGRLPYNMQLMGSRDRIRFLLSKDLFRPNDKDRAIIRLPKSLHAFYYLIRPVRILWDRSVR